MPVGQVTVTGKTMGGLQVTAKVIPNVESLHFDCNDQLLFVNTLGNVRSEYDISGAVAITATIAAGNLAVVVA